MINKNNLPVIYFAILTIQIQQLLQETLFTSTPNKHYTDYNPQQLTKLDLK